jgi:hypothetical protein
VSDVPALTIEPVVVASVRAMVRMLITAGTWDIMTLDLVNNPWSRQML